jgi:GNAT superfamily N-acetyltransferase
VVAAAISLIVKYSRWGQDHRYWDIVGNGYLTTHDPKGDVLYGVDVFVHPDYRDLRLGRRLYDARKELCEKMNLRGIVVGGRIPGYHKQYAEEMTPQQYVAKVQSRELTDPILTFQLANDFQVRRIVRGYLPDDKPSAGFAVLLEWVNIYHEEGRPDDRRAAVGCAHRGGPVADAADPTRWKTCTARSNISSMPCPATRPTWYCSRSSSTAR